MQNYTQPHIKKTYFEPITLVWHITFHLIHILCATSCLSLLKQTWVVWQSFLNNFLSFSQNPEAIGLYPWSFPPKNKCMCLEPDMLFGPQTLHRANCLKDRSVYFSQLTTIGNSLQSSYERLRSAANTCSSDGTHKHGSYIIAGSSFVSERWKRSN